MTNARAYWDSVSGYGDIDHSDDIGNIDYLDRLDYDVTVHPVISYLPYSRANYRDSLNYLLGLPPTEILFQT